MRYFRENLKALTFKNCKALSGSARHVNVESIYSKRNIPRGTEISFCTSRMQQNYVSLYLVVNNIGALTTKMGDILL
jgi:hypothetical protein